MTTRIKIPDEIFTSAEEQLKQAFGGSLRDSKSVLIGDPSSQAIFVDSNTKTEIYTHGFGADSSGVTIVSASGIPESVLRYKKPILIIKTDSGQYRYVGTDVQADEIYSAGLPETHTQDPVYMNQFRWSTIHPYAGLQVLVVGAFYDNTWVGDLITDAFDGTATDTSASSISVPTTNNRQIAVLIQVNPTAKALEYKQSAEYSAFVGQETAANNGYLPTTDANRYRVGFVFLKAGASAITYGDIWEAPEFISKGSSSFGFPHTITSDVVIETGYQQLFKGGLVFNGGSLTINGQLVFI